MKKILFVLLFGLLACESTQDRVARFRYVKDERTHLCFATYGLGQNYGTITHVPCNADVEEAIKMDQAASRAKR